MRNAIQQGDESILVIGSNPRNPLYFDSLEAFAKRYGSPAPVLPGGVTQRIYEQGVRHALFADDNVIGGGPQPWPPGDAIIKAFFGTESPPPPPPVPGRSVLKSVVLSRLTDDQLDKALGLMTNRQKERWRSPDVQAVFADDKEVIGLVKAIGADPNIVLA